jgi:cob(I)alamin adenosyltransferase
MSKSKSSADTSSTLALEDDPRPDGLRSAKSLVLVLTGNGKGKSSSAFGMVMRAVAREWKVCVVQFIKSSEWQVGEQKICESLNVQWHSLGGGFTWDSNNIEHDKDLARKAWEVSTRLIQSGEFDLIVLDEVTYLMAWNWVEHENILEVIADRPQHVNLICTGRDAPQSLIDIADTVTSMTNLKHAYESGIAAKKGIDY